jgi:hypothetical protein
MVAEKEGSDLITRMCPTKKASMFVWCLDAEATLYMSVRIDEGHSKLGKKIQHFQRIFDFFSFS